MSRGHSCPWIRGVSRPRGPRGFPLHVKEGGALPQESENTLIRVKWFATPASAATRCVEKVVPGTPPVVQADDPGGGAGLRARLTGCSPNSTDGFRRMGWGNNVINSKNSAGMSVLTCRPRRRASSLVIG